MEWRGCELDEYEKLVNRMNKPRVVIDNVACASATLVKVDSARRRGMLLEAVQLLTDLNLSIAKAYVSSDGRWFMDVFYVTDRHTRKLHDQSLLSFIEESLSRSPAVALRAFGSGGGLSELELTGTNRPGLLSEVFAVLLDLQLSIVDAKVWTHNGRFASLMSLKEPIEDAQEAMTRMEGRLRNVLKGDSHVRGAKTAVSCASEITTHSERRLHQMMFADRDYERTGATEQPVSVQNWAERGYSIVSVRCRDRAKLLFDVVCTLTDMDYVVFHGTVDSDREMSRQEFYVRHADGNPISSEAEKQRVIQCLQAAIERRESKKGLPLELCVADHPGLLSETTRTFRENGLSITKAEISTKHGMTSDIFYVTDSTGDLVDRKTIDAIRREVGVDCLKVWQPLPVCDTVATAEPRGAASDNGGYGFFSIGSMVKRNLANLGLMGSC